MALVQSPNNIPGASIKVSKGKLDILRGSYKNLSTPILKVTLNRQIGFYNLM